MRALRLWLCSLGCFLAVQGMARASLVFSGEDLNPNEDIRLTSYPNALSAHDQFFSHLLPEVGTETFESFPGHMIRSGFIGPFPMDAPLTVTFPGAGMATLSGGGFVNNVPAAIFIPPP